MTGHPQPRRTTARPNPLHTQRRLPFVSLALLLALVLVLSIGLLLAGCGSETTTTSAPAPTTASSAAATTTSAGDGTPTTSAQPNAFPVTVTDDNGNSVTVEARPMRIVSTAPAGTEALFALGAGDRVVGVSSLDDYPAEVADIAKVGDFQVNTEAVMGLSPDLVLAYSGNEEALAPVEATGCPVIVFNPTSIDGIYANLITVGAVTGNNDEAAALVDSIKAEIEKIRLAASVSSFAPKVFYALDNTLWTAGPGSFVDEILKLVNAVNVGSMQGGNAAAQQYYQFAPEQLIAADPDVILLPNTAYKSIDEFVNDARFAGLTAVKEGHVYLIDDVIVTRPGPRVAEGIKAVMEAVRPGAM